MATDRNTKLTALLLGAVGILMSVAAIAEDRILITTEFPDEGDADVIEKPIGAVAGGGNFISGGPQLNEPQKIVYGPDGNLYLLDEQNIDDKGCCVSDNAYAVLRYDGTSGDFMDTFVSPGSSDLNEAKDMIFGPDGNLYITANEIEGNDQEFCADDQGGGAVLRFNGTTGAFMDVFVVNGAGNTDGGGDDDDDWERVCEVQALAFTAAGDLLVGNSNDDTSGNHNILRFDGTTGAYIDTFVANNDNGLHDPQYMVFGPDGHLYISRNDDGGTNPSTVLRYNGTTGAFINAFVSSESGGLAEPMGLAFGFDGSLYVVDGESPGAIRRYNGTTGAFLDSAVPTESSNMRDSRSLLFIMRVAEIPTLNPWAMALLALALAGLAGFVLVRRKRGAAA